MHRNQALTTETDLAGRLQYIDHSTGVDVKSESACYKWVPRRSRTEERGVWKGVM